MHPLISCDDHMDLSQLPSDLWTSRLPEKLLDRAPRVEIRNGNALWICDGRVWGRWVGLPTNEGNARTIKPSYTAFDRAGLHDPSPRRAAVAELRLEDMDRDQVTTQVVFGPVHQITTYDQELREECYKVYNDWIIDFCDAAPDRLVPVPMLPEWPSGAIRELNRLKEKGRVRIVNLAVAGLLTKFDDSGWEPFWSAIEESEIALAWHIVTFGAPDARVAGKEASAFETTKLLLTNFLEPFVDLFAWGILERHPKLKIVLAEGGTGWLPWLVHELDYRHERLWEAEDYWKTRGGITLKTKPSELFKKNIYVTFQEDHVAMQLLPFFGEDKLLWASDYPHPDSVWPDSLGAIERQMGHLSPELRKMITYGNAAELLGL